VTFGPIDADWCGSKNCALGAIDVKYVLIVVKTCPAHETKSCFECIKKRKEEKKDPSEMTANSIITNQFYFSRMPGLTTVKHLL